MTGTVYLLHFARPYKHARHYIGWTSDLDARLAEHQAGHGARLLAVVKAAGITWTLARTWDGTRNRERSLKRQGGARRCCPMCGVRPRPTPTPTPPPPPPPELVTIIRPRPGDQAMLAKVAAVFLAGETRLPLHEITRRLPVRPDGPRFGWETSVMAATLRRNGVIIHRHSHPSGAVLLGDLRTTLALAAPDPEGQAA
ncbi:hypothetical protein AB0F17_16980 [Nonomuraea sp. NPDC026600]|uniref:hypothetical protein n=1 Tax=Nonomuraea sp. NPDC026600 TaxID=3155363 RepID=UPI0033C90601